MNGLRFALLPTSILALMLAIFVLVPNAILFLAFKRDAFLAGELWRVLTFPFVHVNGAHLLENVAALLVASLLAYEVGLTLREYIVAFVLACLAVAMTDLTFFPALVLAGASTGIFAIYGAFAMRGSVFVHRGWLVAIIAVTVFTKYGIGMLTGTVTEAAWLETLMHFIGFCAGLAVIVTADIISRLTRQRVLA